MGTITMIDPEVFDMLNDLVFEKIKNMVHEHPSKFRTLKL